MYNEIADYTSPSQNKNASVSLFLSLSLACLLSSNRELPHANKKPIVSILAREIMKKDSVDKKWKMIGDYHHCFMPLDGYVMKLNTAAKFGWRCLALPIRMRSRWFDWSTWSDPSLVVFWLAGSSWGWFNWSKFDCTMCSANWHYRCYTANDLCDKRNLVVKIPCHEVTLSYYFFSQMCSFLAACCFPVSAINWKTWVLWDMSLIKSSNTHGNLRDRYISIQ